MTFCLLDKKKTMAIHQKYQCNLKDLSFNEKQDKIGMLYDLYEDTLVSSIIYTERLGQIKFKWAIGGHLLL